jgi:ABC-2 type transport system permease protein
MSDSRCSTTAAIRIAARRELRDLWLRGRGLPLLIAYALLLSITSYVTATNRELNFLEQREALNQTLQIAVAIAALLVLVAAADAVSGERDRGTLEPLMVTPVRREALLAGKAIAVLSLWFAAYVTAVPYIAYLARGTRVSAAALVGGLVVGTALAVFAAAAGLVLSVVAPTSRASIAIGMFVLVALFAPTQLPTSARQAWLGTLLLHANPFTSGLRYLGKLVVDANGYADDIGWLVGPLVAAGIGALVAAVIATRITLAGGLRS